MILQVSGGHGVGKTFLSKKLAQLLGYKYVSLDPLAFGVSREDTCKPDFPQKQFMKWQMQTQKQMDNIVTDRGPEDAAAYAVAYGLLSLEECMSILRSELEWRKQKVQVILLEADNPTYRPETQIPPEDIAELIRTFLLAEGLRWIRVRWRLP